MNFFTNVLQFLVRKQDSLWKLAFLVMISFFLAKTVNLFVAHYFLPLDFSHVASPSSRPSSGSDSAVPQPDIRKILSRNIFDSEAQRRLVSRDLPRNQGGISPSTLPFELLGTIVFSKPEFSVALIKDRNGNRNAYYATGNMLQSAVIRSIERFRVILENGGRLESLELKAAESKIATAPRLFSAPAVSAGENSVAFEEIGPNRYAVPSSLIDETMSNFSQILTQSRMVPNLTPDNRTDGFRVFQIKPGSLFQKMGMLDQDVIKRVNGQDLDSFEKATGLFGTLRNEKTISIDIVRNGAKINYTYEIR